MYLITRFLKIYLLIDEKDNSILVPTNYHFNAQTGFVIHWAEINKL